MIKISQILSKSDINDANIPLRLDSGIYIYGAGELGLLAIEYCEACNIPIAGVIDRNKKGFVSGVVTNYEICEPHKVSLLNRLNIPIAVAVATVPYNPIANTLKSMGWRTVVPFYRLTKENRPEHPLSNGWIIGSVNNHELHDISLICENFADEESRVHYEAFIAWHIDYSELTLTNYPIDPTQRYTIKPLLNFLLRNNRQFVDVGSHKGSAVQRLNNKNIFFDEYILIEPDENSRNNLTSVAKKLRKHGRQVTIINNVVGATRSIQPFQNGRGYCSQIWKESKTYREVLPIDEYKLKPNFIKVHTEGSEFDVLKGGENTIKKNRPAIVFSVYHNRNGLCSDIVGVMDLFINYLWYFRLHSYQGTGAFVYGIPN